MEYIELYQRILGDSGKRSGKKIAFPCWRCDKGKPGKRHFFVNPVNGRYKCYKCGFDPDGLGSGTAKFFARLMGYTGELPDEGGMTSYKGPKNHFNQEQATQVYTTLIDNMPLLPEHRELVMHERGIRHPEWFGIKSCVGAERFLRSRFHKSMLLASGLFYEHEGRLLAHKTIWESRILVPYKDKDKNTYFLKSRRTKDDGTMKYASPIDAEGSKRIWGRIVPGYDTLVVTEGEFKAMASVEAKVYTWSLPGMTSSHHTLIEMLRGSVVKYLIICFDTQTEDMEDVDQAANALARRAREELGIMVLRARLPLDPRVNSGEKMDIDTFLYYHTTLEYQAVLKESVPALVGN